ncbi:hypothetical protein AKJ49_01150, partial [candidate division MSBL1 archaeon SCGC-AAA382A03]
MKKKILVAVDGSDYSHKAFKHALKEAKKQESHLTILKVVPNFGYDEKTMEKPLKKEIKKAEELTEEWKEKAEKKGIEAEDIETVHVERYNLTLRNGISRLIRKSLCFS